ncbi:MAG: pyrroline-5-carboxylate reductase [Sphingobacteriales bacterium]|jgi:pyrroline-5-carboxylate reductase|nr:pyrroline-5-carboxylate reductase [Sphingobacteriales bacterium]
MKVLIIGGGSMGYTFAESFLSSHVIRPNDLTILDHNTQRIELLMRQLKANIETKPDNFISEQDLIVLAVKPQDSEKLCNHIRTFIKPNQVVLSIMAGVKMATLQNALGLSKIIRAMPNLPAQVGMGMTAFTASDEVSRHELIEVQNLLSTTGRAIYFEREDMIDAATAVSGSGPAYVYYFMQNMIDAATQIGFSESQAELMVWQTMLGALHLHNKSNLSCNEWIKRVASKGGTTEAALNVFNQNQMSDTIQQGIKAAFDRAEELGR